MTVPIPDLPTEFSTEWWAHYQAIHAAVRELQGLYVAIVPPTGFIAKINNTLTPDVDGNVNIAASDIDAMASSYQPGLTDTPLTQADWVYKSAGGTGVWPTGYGPDGTADYTGGTADNGTRPHDRDKPVIWLGDAPYPPTVDSGVSGMRRGKDQTATPEP